MCLNYNQYKRSLSDNGDMLLHSMMVGEKCPKFADIMDTTLAKSISISANNGRYGGMAEKLIVNYVHLLFLKAKYAASREENPNWREETSGAFSENYWKAMKSEIASLESMGAWEIVDQYESMHVIYSAWDFKFKCHPGGLIKKFKAQFCARGNQ